MIDDLYICIHPVQHYCLRVIFARWRYKHESWLRRWISRYDRVYVGGGPYDLDDVGVLK